MTDAQSQLDAHVREIVHWHFSPDTGTPHWLEFAESADWNPLELSSRVRNDMNDIGDMVSSTSICATMVFRMVSMRFSVEAVGLFMRSRLLVPGKARLPRRQLPKPEAACAKPPIRPHAGRQAAISATCVGRTTRNAAPPCPGR